MKTTPLIIMTGLAIASLTAHADGGHRGEGYGRQGSYAVTAPGYTAAPGYAPPSGAPYGQPVRMGPAHPQGDAYRYRPENGGYRRHGEHRGYHPMPAVVYQPVVYQPVRGERWQRGGVVPAAYRHARYQVDYRPYRLSAPPAGYGWVRINRDAVLAAVATGVIATVAYNVFH